MNACEMSEGDRSKGLEEVESSGTRPRAAAASSGVRPKVAAARSRRERCGGEMKVKSRRSWVLAYLISPLIARRGKKDGPANLGFY